MERGERGPGRLVTDAIADEAMDVMAVTLRLAKRIRAAGADGVVTVAELAGIAEDARLLEQEASEVVAASNEATVALYAGINCMRGAMTTRDRKRAEEVGVNLVLFPSPHDDNQAA